MKLPFMLRSKCNASKSPWPWPSCSQPRTLSFNNNPQIPSCEEIENELPESFFTNSSEAPSFSASSSDDNNNNHLMLPAADCCVETLIRSLRSERLFFEPDETSLILPGAASKEEASGVSLESVALSMESRDPFGDFKKSMEEMIEAYKLNDWESFEELLAWYLEVNGETNHGFIIGAFVDLLLGGLSLSLV